LRNVSSISVNKTIPIKALYPNKLDSFLKPTKRKKKKRKKEKMILGIESNFIYRIENITHKIIRNNGEILFQIKYGGVIRNKINA